MRVIFLDFDGVLNATGPDDVASVATRDASFELWSAEQLDRWRVELVNDIIDRTGAVVVLSTSWRNMHTTTVLRRILKSMGFLGHIIGTTPQLHRGATGQQMGRCDEISQLLFALGDAVESYVILDDLDMHHLSANHVQTDVDIGLTADHVDRAVAILTGTKASGR